MSEKDSKSDECLHDEFCGFAHTVCETTDFKDKCRLKDTDISEMPLMETIKESYDKHKAEGVDLQKKK
ncbi:MAG: hypothetical protein GQ570_07720 [Helicobacteraceae bacterium]|nr:hypothetical protein [Helicobacteraceae bacterium]